MHAIVEVRAIVRTAMLDRVVRCLKDAGMPRLTVTRVHAIGAGVDPATAKPSLEEGAEYAEKALVQCICAAGRAAEVASLIAAAARTGRRGDGIVSLHPVVDVVKIRTGEHGLEALA